MSWTRAVLAWMLIMLLETLHGTARTLWLAPVIGDSRARQIGVPVGCLLVLGVAWFATRWARASTPDRQLALGGAWALLTALFEFALGTALGYDSRRMLADYDFTRGGLMGLGLLFMVLAPLLVSRWRADTVRQE